MTQPLTNETRIIYASRSRGGITLENLMLIQEVSRRNNSRSGLTGLLCHGNNRFLQVLEGDSGKVQDLYATISQDSRHEQALLLENTPIQERSFGAWAMSCVQLGDSADRPVHKIVRNYFSHGVFLPEELQAQDAFNLLQDVAAIRRDAPLDF